MVNIGVLLTNPIQFVMEKAAELIEAKAELAVFAAASALRVRQSAEVVHTRSRQILGKDLSRQLSTVDDKHMEELKNLSSHDLSSLRSRLTSSVSISATGMRGAYRFPLQVSSNRFKPLRGLCEHVTGLCGH